MGSWQWEADEASSARRKADEARETLASIWENIRVAAELVTVIEGEDVEAADLREATERLVAQRRVAWDEIHSLRSAIEKLTAERDRFRKEYFHLLLEHTEVDPWGDGQSRRWTFSGN